jgi:hypothetical protein
MKKSIGCLISSAILSLCVIYLGCGEDEMTGNNYTNNPNVRSFDSIGVEEDSAAFQSYTGMDLLNGISTLDTAQNRDCSLNDSANAGENFYLQNGVLDNLLPAGYDIRFFKVFFAQEPSSTTFDTLTQIWGKTLDSNDFTQNSTDVWGYFNAPLSSYPIFCFWLKGKKEAGITPYNVYGIIQPREAFDRTPGMVYGFRMSFRARINTHGENDFRKQIP